jgi:hypothetical protein
MPSKRIRLLSLVSLLIAVSSFVGCSSAQADRTEAFSAVSQAEQAIRTGFVSLEAADRARADVSVLAGVLNQALRNLSEAKRALKAGLYGEVISTAHRAADVADRVGADAAILRRISENRISNGFMNQVVISFMVALFIILSGFIVWKRFKSHFLREALGFRPELPVDRP